MKNIKLHSMEINNFRGISELSFLTSSKSINIYGANGAGKSTIKLAFLWLLNATNDLGAPIDPRVINDNAIDDSVTNIVSAVFDTDGDLFSLKKSHVAKRNRQKEVTGYTTSYYINDVPLSDGEYKSRLDEIFTESEILKSITSPFYFASLMPWAKRREILLSMCDIGEIKSPFPGKDVDGEKKRLEEDRRIQKTNLAKFVPAIDELSKQLVDEKSGNAEELKKEIARFADAAKKADKEYDLLISGGKIGDLQQKLANIDREIADEETKFLRSKNDALELLAKKKRELKEKSNNFSNKIHVLLASRTGAIQEVEANAKLVTKLRDDFRQIANVQFLANDEMICETCKQIVPAERQHEVFNLQQSKTKEEIQTKGKELVAQNTKLSAEIDQLEGEIIEAQADLKAVLDEKEIIDQQIKEQENT